MSGPRTSPSGYTSSHSISFISMARSVHRYSVQAAEGLSQSLLGLELHERRALMLEHFQPVEGEFAFATSSDGSTIEEIQAFLELSVKDGCEGLMVKMLKTPASTYEPSRRSQNWLKVRHYSRLMSSILMQAIDQEGLFVRSRRFA